MLRWLLPVFALMISAAMAPAMADDRQLPTPREVVEHGVAAHGGDVWMEPGTLVLTGQATFYSADSMVPRITSDDYRMWRVMEPNRSSAHGADGMVRITAKSAERVIFEVGYDGETTWNERGIVPKAEADAFWASNFGFGIIRSALKEGFTLQSAPQREIGGRAINIVRVIDPKGAETVFGFDSESHFIRYMAFRSPRGFHERFYDDFVRLDNGWVQARSVTLLYDGIISNTVLWTQAIVGEPIPPETFTPPADTVRANAPSGETEVTE